MADIASFKYRAFLSYSHRDERWAAWLHRALETHHIDKELVGRETTVGPLPPKLRPIFRDREDFSAGHSLSEQSLAAIERSQFMIVLCSPNSAKSKYVNEEIRCFKALGRGSLVLPIIIDGEPGDPERECFPPALRFKIGADGALTDEREEPIAADARAIGDGRELAKLKLVAGLLGVGLDEIVRREELARRRRKRVRNSIVAGFVFLTVMASGGFAVAMHQWQHNEGFLDRTIVVAVAGIERAVALAEKRGVSRSTTLESLRIAENTLINIADLGNPTRQIRFRKAWMSLAFARNYGVLGQSEQQRARALHAQKLLTALVADVSDNPDYLRELSAAHNEVGRVLYTQGQYPQAIESLSEGLAISDRLLESKPDNLRWQQDRSFALDMLGDLYFRQRNIPMALKYYQAALAVDDKLAKDDPDNWQLQRDLSVAYVKIGDILASQGDRAGALAQYRAALAIRQRRAAAESNHTGALRDLAVAYLRIGDTLIDDKDLAEKDLAEAQRLIAQSVAVRRRLAALDASNAGWQRDLAIALNKLGGLHLLRKNPQDALRILLDSALITERLVRLDPKALDWKRDLELVYNNIAFAIIGLDNLRDVFTAIRLRLVSLGKAAIPLATDHDAEANFARAMDSLGAEIMKVGQPATALASFRILRLVRESLADNQPDNAAWRRDVAFSHRRLAAAHEHLRQHTDALEELRTGHAIMVALVKNTPERAEWKTDLDGFAAEIVRVSELPDEAPVPVPR